MIKALKSYKHILILIVALFCFNDNVLGFTSKESVSYLGEINNYSYYDLQTNDGISLFCLDAGDNYCGGYTYSESTTYTNKGRACNIISALKAGNITVNSINNTKTDLSNNKASYGKLQEYIWNGSDGADCQDESARSVVNSTSSSGISRIAATVTSNELKNNGDGTYKTEAINVTMTSSNGSKYRIYLIGAPDGAYVIDSDGNQVTESSSSVLYVVVPSNYKTSNFKLKLVGTYTATKSTTVYSVVLKAHTTTASASSCAGNSTKNQRLGIVSASSETINTSTSTNPYAEISFQLPSCIADFNTNKDTNGIVSMPKRIELYKKYNDKRSLLNMSNDTATKACNGELDCTNHVKIGCLSAIKTGAGINTFGLENLSCYEETINVGNYTGYCGVNFNLVHNLTSTGKSLTLHDFGTNFKSGQMILKRNNSVIAKGTITKTCYVYGNIGNSNLTTENNSSYSDYIGKLEFNNLELGFDETVENEKDSKDGYTTFTKSITAEYKLNPVYSEIGTGKISYQSCLNCKFLGYGFASKLDAADGLHNAQFDLVIEETLVPSEGVIKVENACQYTVKNEIIDDKGNLNLEFRVIDTTNPFPGKSGNGRNVGENWCAVNPDIDGSGIINTIDSKMIKSWKSEPNKLKEIDINKDGEVDKKDTDLLIKIIMGNFGSVRAGKDCSSTNYYIKSVMQTTNNSYDKNKTGPKYSVMLDRETISKIKQDNKNINYLYDAFDLTCESGENCTDYFLKNILGINNEK